MFVADGYGNHRIVVLDADTGAFKRMWGAFGNPPSHMGEEPCFPQEAKTFAGVGAANFSIPHVLLLSRDGLLYVADRNNRRIQIFTPEGEFVRQLVRYDAPFARNLAFSPDPEQTYLYTGYGDGIAMFDRKSLEFIGMIQVQGVATGPGHQINMDSKGNLYVTGGTMGTLPMRPTAGRLIYKGMSSPPIKGCAGTPVRRSGTFSMHDAGRHADRIEQTGFVQGRFQTPLLAQFIGEPHQGRCLRRLPLRHHEFLRHAEEAALHHLSVGNARAKSRDAARLKPNASTSPPTRSRSTSSFGGSRS